MTTTNQSGRPANPGSRAQQSRRSSRAGARALRAPIAILCALLVALAPLVGHAQSTGRFFAETGFAVTDEDGVAFLSELRRLGGISAVGYPVSRRFQWDGFTVQVFQRVVFQWQPGCRCAMFVNVFDRLNELGKDDWLLAVRQTPKHDPTLGDASARLALLEARPAIRAAYFAVPGDPVQSNGLPTSRVQDMGNHYALRAQRVVFQEWKEDVPWARRGQVTVALGGDIAKEAGILGDANAFERSGARQPAPATAGSPARTEERTFHSPILGRDMHYFAFVPPGYDANPTARYPVAYMLHGNGGSDTEWRGYGLLSWAEGAMSRGEVRPWIIVLPQGDMSYWHDHPFGGPRWGAYVAEDVVREIESRYRAIPDRAYRAVGGLSMGALGALQLSVNYPHVFGIAGSHGPTLRDYALAREQLGIELAGSPDDYRRINPADLLLDHPEVARTLQIWIDVGEQDVRWRAAAERLHQQLLAAGVPHDWQVLPGRHNGDEYWRPHGPIYLRFYDRAFWGDR